jgi:DNA-binding LacI/PurR family transcriptional regulator
VPQDWSNYWTLIEKEARNLARKRGLEVVSFYGVTRHVDEPDYQRLVRDAAEGRLAGIFSVYPLGSDFSYDFRSFNGPMVAVSESAPPHTYALDNDRWGLVEKAARFFAQKGHRRVAWIGEQQHMELRQRLGGLSLGGQAASSLFPDDLAIALNASSRETAEPLVRLLLRQTPEHRPDGLLIMDDHLTAPALRGLAGSGARVSEDVDVVSHCNYPAIPDSDVRVRWLGFDAADLVMRAFDMIREGRALQRGETGRKALEAGPPHLLPALWEEEWKAKAATEAAARAVA